MSRLILPYSNRFGGGVGGSEFIVDAAEFNNADGLRRGAALDGVDLSKSVTLVYWFNAITWDEFDPILNAARTVGGDGATGGGHTSHFDVDNTTLNRTIRTKFYNTSSTQIFQASSSSMRSVNQWNCFMLSIDLSSTARRHIYMNDVDERVQSTYTNDNIDFPGMNDWSVGMEPDLGSKMNARLAELWFAPGFYIDFSVEANRRLFRSESGKPVNLGSDGSAPGVQPAIYLHLDDGEAPANFALNRGYGGDFNITGTLTTAASSPSD